MQTLPSTLLDRLRRDLDPSFMVEDFVFSPGDFPSLVDLAAVADDLSVVEVPRIVRRTVGLRGRVAALELGLALGVEGTDPAFALLVGFLQTFQRPIPFDAVVYLQDPPIGIGDSGLAWAWDGGPDLDVLAFLRANVLVTLKRHAGVDPIAVAREVDHALESREHVIAPPVNPYYGLEGSGEGAMSTLAVAAGSRVALPIPPSLAGRSLFFATAQGSANRDPDDPGRWYYRAGLDPGSVTVDVLAVGRGLVPFGARIPVVVTG
jgi:hypothetical protein